MADSKKSVLIFCPTFFGYEHRVENAFRDAGFDVSLYDERPNNRFICKTALRLKLGFYKPVVTKYVKGIIEENKDKKFDYVVVVKSEAITEIEVALLRKAYPEAKFILYFWDSVANVPDGEKKMSLYDRVVSFDPNDAKKYNLPFLSVPYGKEYVRGESDDVFEYDAAFIGTAHSVRPRVVKQIKEQCEQMGKSCFTYFYSPHILVFLLNKFTNKDYKYISLKEINFKPLSTEQVCEIYAKSRCVLDIEHPKQNGTTTRPVEMLPMRKKIITTNAYVKNFSFYNENNFLVINRDKPVIAESFFDSDYINVSDDIINEYSPGSFVEKLLENV